MSNAAWRKKNKPEWTVYSFVGDLPDPVLEVDEYYEQALKGVLQMCIFSFTAPHNVVVGLKCPTIPVLPGSMIRFPMSRLGRQ